MAIIYPLSLPAGIEITRLAFKPVEVVGASVSPFTLETQTQRHQGQAWMIDIDLAPMRRAQAEEMIGFKLSLKGRHGTFLLGDIMGAVPRGAATGTPVAESRMDSDSDGEQATNLIRDEILYTRGWTGLLSGALKTGDYLQLGSGASAHLHKVLSDVDADSDGLAAIDIWPRLRDTVADGAPLILTDTAGLFRLAGNTMDWSVDGAEIYGLSFSAVEAL